MFHAERIEKDTSSFKAAVILRGALLSVERGCVLFSTSRSMSEYTRLQILHHSEMNVLRGWC
jgi:hypothetical protein